MTNLNGHASDATSPVTWPFDTPGATSYSIYLLCYRTQSKHTKKRKVH